jgi:hypothetical protein
LLVIATGAPPAGAAEFKVRVQVDAAFMFNPPGVHATDEMAGTTTFPPVWDTARTEPAPLTPTELVIASGVVTPVAGTES